jgi:hypothetical protein
MNPGPHFEFGKGCASLALATSILALPKFAQCLYELDYEKVGLSVRDRFTLRRHGCLRQ